MLFVTGIPRSGTSLMAHLLDQLPNIVMLNEPREVPHLFKDESLESFFSAYKIWRSKIANREGIENQSVDNIVVSDTWSDGERRLYCPTVSQEDFVLGTKNPLAYLIRLQSIRRAFPGAHILILVRHPYHTIKSWKRTFSHLRDAAISESAVFNFANESQRRDIDKLVEIKDLITRRASLWNYLATQILAHMQDTVVIRYEDLIANPFPYLQEIYQGLFPGASISDVQSLSSRNSPLLDDLDGSERACIKDVCGASAGRLGYEDL